MKSQSIYSASATNFMLTFLIVCLLSNAFLVTDILIAKDNIALSTDIENNSKEDKNTLDIEEEPKILDYFSHHLYSNVSANTSNYLILGIKDVLNTEDLPPPEHRPVV
jgi:hypothetical protein